MTSHLKDDGWLSRLVMCLFSFKSKNNSDYIKLLSKFNVQIVEIEDEEHCQIALQSINCNGILIDIPTYIKSSMYIKEFISHIEDIYPSARIRYNGESEEIELAMLSERNQISLQEFLENYCANFDARRLRRHKRLVLNLNLRLFWEHEDKSADFLCTSVNISESGLFIVDRTSGLHILAKVKIQILELHKNHFLHGTVVRSMEWGEKHFHAPGFGIRIDHIDEEIYEDFVKLTKKH
jgi:hypothetical protein